jgi:hypothetical protein
MNRPIEMNRTTPIRNLSASAGRHVQNALIVGMTMLFYGGFAWGWQGYPQQSRPAPVVREAPQNAPRNQGLTANGFAPRSGQNQEHLQQWMQSHSNLTLDQQQRALDNEAGFRQLNPQMQQRMHERLAQLNGMTPQQRDRAFSRTEAMERLTPQQRVQVRSALTSLGALPKDRRMYVAREFRAMREMPPGERQAYLNSPAMRAQFSDQERQTLNGLFEVAPYLPAPAQPGPMGAR